MQKYRAHQPTRLALCLLTLCPLTLCLLTRSPSVLAQDFAPKKIHLSKEAPQSSAILVDLRQGSEKNRSESRRALQSSLSSSSLFSIHSDPELVALLSFSPYSENLHAGESELLAASLTASCSHRVEKAESAILHLAAAQAEGLSVKEKLQQAYVFILLCSDRSREVDKALMATRMLSQIGKERPSAVSQKTWYHYLPPDAQSNVFSRPVHFDSPTEGLGIWVDFEKRGVTPQKILLEEGAHILAVGGNQGGIAKEIKIEAQKRLVWKLPPQTRKWQELKALLNQLKEAEASSLSKRLTSIMAASNSQIAFLMRAPGNNEVWVLDESSPQAKLLGSAPTGKVAKSIAHQYLSESSFSDAQGPSHPLFLQMEKEKSSRGLGKKEWLIFGGAITAAAIGAVLMLTLDLSDDRQSIEVVLP